MGVLDDVRALAEDLEAGGTHARFVARDVRHVETGLARAMSAKAHDDHLGAAMWKRLAVEAALRIAWVTGDDLVEGSDGEVVATRDVVQSRCDRLLARDTLNLASAFRAITEIGGSEPDVEIVAAARALALRQSPDPAPRNLSDLAVNVSQRALYSQHRFCSSVLHPGTVSGEVEAQRLATEVLDQVGTLAVAFGRAARKVLS